MVSDGLDFFLCGMDLGGLGVGYHLSVRIILTVFVGSNIICSLLCCVRNCEPLMLVCFAWDLMSFVRPLVVLKCVM